MELSQNDKNRLIDFYGQALKAHGPGSPYALRWLSAYGQQLRFELLCRIGNLSGKRILDVGCGVGDLYGYLSGRFSGFKYLGIDILPEMVNQARKKYPQGNFWVQDIFNLEPCFDFVLASGSLTFNLSGGREFYYDMVKQMFSIAREGVGFNMLDDAYFPTDDFYLSYNWQEVAQVSKQLTNRYKVISGYDLGDFTMLLYKL